MMTSRETDGMWKRPADCGANNRCFCTVRCSRQGSFEKLIGNADVEHLKLQQDARAQEIAHEAACSSLRESGIGRQEFEPKPGHGPVPEPASALDTQVGGDHYKKLGDYQPWAVLKAWLTPEEFRGYMKGTAIAYLARERDKGGDQDVQKAAHTLQGLVEMLAGGAK